MAGQGTALAFHEGGVANCGGCHVSHDSSGVSGIGLDPLLLKGPSPSDVCLSCHARATSSVFGSDPLSPPPERGAGNFVFLLEDNLNDDTDGATDPIPGDAAGHNLAAPGNGLSVDPRYAVAPGGTFLAADMGCTSCHDPHGNDNFRMLHSVGPVMGGLATFTWPAPQADGIGLLTEEAQDNHTAYRSGMSDWCGNCHGQYHDSGNPAFEHPSGETLDTTERDEYNLYDGPANPDGGFEATAYLAEVPFEDPGNTTTSTAGPSAAGQIMCLTCHRAHASSAPASGRWDFNVTLLQDDGVVSGSYPIPDPYASPDQGQLCRKCHETIPD